MICWFSWFYSSIYRCVPQEVDEVSQGTELSSPLHMDIGRDKVRVVRRRPTSDGLVVGMPLEWEVL